MNDFLRQFQEAKLVQVRLAAEEKAAFEVWDRVRKRAAAANYQLVQAVLRLAGDMGVV